MRLWPFRSKQPKWRPAEEKYKYFCKNRRTLIHQFTNQVRSMWLDGRRNPRIPGINPVLVQLSGAGIFQITHPLIGEAREAEAHFAKYKKRMVWLKALLTSLFIFNILILSSIFYFTLINFPTAELQAHKEARGRRGITEILCMFDNPRCYFAANDESFLPTNTEYFILHYDTSDTIIAVLLFLFLSTPFIWVKFKISARLSCSIYLHCWFFMHFYFEKFHNSHFQYNFSENSSMLFFIFYFLTVFISISIIYVTSKIISRYESLENGLLFRFQHVTTIVWEFLLEKVKRAIEILSQLHSRLFEDPDCTYLKHWLIGASVGGVAASSEAHSLSILSARLPRFRRIDL